MLPPPQWEPSIFLHSWKQLNTSSAARTCWGRAKQMKVVWCVLTFFSSAVSLYVRNVGSPSSRPVFFRLSTFIERFALLVHFLRNTCTPAMELQHVIENSETRVILGLSQAYWATLLALHNETCNIEHIEYFTVAVHCRRPVTEDKVSLVHHY